MYYSIDGRYEGAPVLECQIVTSWSRFPLASFLAVTDNCTVIRCSTNLDPLVADFVFNHTSCNRLRIGIHYCAPVPPVGMSTAPTWRVFFMPETVMHRGVPVQAGHSVFAGSGGSGSLNRISASLSGTPARG